MHRLGLLLPFGIGPLNSRVLQVFDRISISTKFCRSLLLCLPPKTYALFPFMTEICPHLVSRSLFEYYTIFQYKLFEFPVYRNSVKSISKQSSTQSYFPEHPPIMYSLLLWVKDDANFLAFGFKTPSLSFIYFHSLVLRLKAHVSSRSWKNSPPVITR
jgi:hypothetical protein